MIKYKVHNYRYIFKLKNEYDKKISEELNCNKKFFCIKNIFNSLKNLFKKG